jgi:hypothetical protein
MDSMVRIERECEHPPHAVSEVDSAKILMTEAKERSLLRFQNVMDIMPGLRAT